MHHLETPQTSKHEPYLNAEMIFENGGCEIVIAALGFPTEFFIEGRNIFAGTGKCLVFREVDHDERARNFDRMCDMYLRQPEKVEIVERSTGRTVAVHKISSFVGDVG
jgi:hypothetical protein